MDHTFEEIVSIQNLLAAWREFIEGKRGKRDVHEFSLRLMENILDLHSDLVNGTYRHGGYQAFTICDPKPRNIHKPTVRDRLLHHAIYRQLYPFFDRTFVADSFSCRLDKGTHKALNRFHAFAYKATKNNTRTCWILKCDIRRFFANIDHAVLQNMLANYITDRRTLELLGKIIGSFTAGRPGVGLPLGNLTSQLLVNVYMNEFDQFLKHTLKVKYYLRYADDFVALSDNRQYLAALLESTSAFLQERLHLKLHEDKIFIKTLASGVDFLGCVHFPDHRVLRGTTKRRMMRRITKNPAPETMTSYLGLLRHGNTHKLREQIISQSRVVAQSGQPASRVFQTLGASPLHQELF